MSEESLNNHDSEEKLHNVTPINGLYENWFLDYASYVILDRAVPHINDGLKPVQRRILHSLKEMDDGRFNKAANVIGNTMKYHPHGDASIGDGMVQTGHVILKPVSLNVLMKLSLIRIQPNGSRVTLVEIASR